MIANKEIGVTAQYSLTTDNRSFGNIRLGLVEEKASPSGKE